MSADLTQAAAQLRRNIDAVERDLRRRYAGTTGGADVDPDLMRDPSGRYILLDARTALVNGLAALARTEGTT